MSLKEKIENLDNKIKQRTTEITKEQIISHNKDVFDKHFNGDDVDGRIFIYPWECKKSEVEGKEHGYVYVGVYDHKYDTRGYIELAGVKVYESENVSFEHQHGEYVPVYHNPKIQKNNNGKEIFTLDELAEFDYEHTGWTWGWPLHVSKNKNKLKATKEVVSEILQQHFDKKNKIKDENKKEQPVEGVNTNKLATLRKKIAHDIDETLGTNLEEKKLPNVIKKRVEEPMSKIVEKLVSNKKVNE